ncbi:helix-turn-helix transcriptional regulator [Trichocoleus sp. FACHB-591]|uniref:helix-turn-helix domain-containing protein n=1 Tax=Trichocoleus sp. FACHB-591 TaxID=2692872 RepID=UPI001689023F
MEFDMEALLVKSGLSPEEAGDRLGKTPQTIRNWLSGRAVPKLEPDEYVQVLEVFSCTPLEFATAFQTTRRNPRVRKKPGRKKMEGKP